MGKKVSDAQTAQWRAELRQGYTLDAVARRHCITTQTVKRHASFDVGGRSLLLGSEVHLDGLRGRWEFQGDIGYTAAGEQYAKFVNVRTGRSRILHTRLLTTVHRGPGRRRIEDGDIDSPASA